jgi:hypothetical protein
MELAFEERRCDVLDSSNQGVAFQGLVREPSKSGVNIFNHFQLPSSIDILKLLASSCLWLF